MIWTKPTYKLLVYWHTRPINLLAKQEVLTHSKEAKIEAKTILDSLLF
jgi:hypothetical protein